MHIANSLDNIVSKLIAANRHEIEIGLPWCKASRVGRNNVWRIDVHSDRREVFFAKCWNVSVVFDRELAGLATMERLASRHEGVMAPEVVMQRDEHGLIVTKCVPGVSFAEILKMAFRIDKNPFNNRQLVDRAHRAMHHIVGLLKCLHSMVCTNATCLSDYTVGAVSKRIAARIDRLSSADRHLLATPALSDFLNRTALQEALAPTYVHGDASPGNFIVHGERVAAIDFEDFGIGSPNRDLSILEYWLGQMSDNWHYRRCPQYFTSNMCAQDSIKVSALYQLELALFRFAWSDKPLRGSARRFPGAATRRDATKIRALIGQVIGAEPTQLV